MSAAKNDYRPGGIVHIRRFGGEIEQMEYRKAAGQVSMGYAEFVEPEEAASEPSEGEQGTKTADEAPVASETPPEVKTTPAKTAAKKTAAKKTTVSGSAPKGQEAVEGENEPHDLL